MTQTYLTDKIFSESNRVYKGVCCMNPFIEHSKIGQNYSMVLEVRKVVPWIGRWVFGDVNEKNEIGQMWTMFWLIFECMLTLCVKFFKMYSWISKSTIAMGIFLLPRQKEFGEFHCFASLDYFERSPTACARRSNAVHLPQEGHS